MATAVRYSDRLLLLCARSCVARLPHTAQGVDASLRGARRAADAQIVVAAPDWLYCTDPRWTVTAGWPALRRGKQAWAVLHLVGCRAKFGQCPGG